MVIQMTPPPVTVINPSIQCEHWITNPVTPKSNILIRCFRPAKVQLTIKDLSGDVHTLTCCYIHALGYGVQAKKGELEILTDEAIKPVEVAQ